MVLECNNLCKRIGKKQILNNITFNINEGEIMGFIGPNGAGKTTTIKLILGLQSITSGQVKINGYDIKRSFEKAIYKVGSIVENPDFYMYLSGYDNLKLSANLYKKEDKIDENRVNEVIKLVGLENRIHDKVSKYSLGMRQRLGIAQAILHRPNLLILDEPTNGLDPEGIKDLRILLSKLAKEEKIAILISSHNLAEIENTCTKITIIKNGEIIESTSIENAKKIDQKTIYEIEVDDTSKIPEITGNSADIMNKNIFKINMEKEEIADLVEKMVKQNIRVYKISEDTTSLEDAFLKKTGGNKIV